MAFKIAAMTHMPQIGFAPGVPHLANLPFVPLHRVGLAGGVVGHLMNLPVFGSLQGAVDLPRKSGEFP